MSNQLRLRGYVHNVTATSKSRGGSMSSFTFALQVDERRKRRCVCFDPSKQKVLKGYELSREPVKFVNVSGNSGGRLLEEEIVVTKRCRVEPANSDIAFEYDERREEEGHGRFTSIGSIKWVAEGEVISVKGCLSVRPEYVRNVVKKDGSVVAMLNRCAVSDESGTIGLTLWGNTIEQVVDNNCYVIEHVRVKKYDLAKCLSTTEQTVVSPAEEVFVAPSEEILEDLFDVKSISVEKISFAQGLKRWLSCCTCRRQLVKVTGGPEMLVKCVKCNTVQQMSSCSTKACVRVAVADDDHQLIWLKAFTPIVEEMLRQPAPDVTVQSCEDEIYEQLFDLRNITLDYSKATGIIKGFYLDFV